MIPALLGPLCCSGLLGQAGEVPHLRSSWMVVEGGVARQHAVGLVVELSSASQVDSVDGHGCGSCVVQCALHLRFPTAFSLG